MEIAHEMRGGCHVLHLRGTLDGRSAVLVRSTLGKLLLDSADPVVADLSGVTDFSREALAVFPAAVTAAGGWPTVRFALSAPSPDLARALHELGMTRRLQLRDPDRIVLGPPGDWRPEVVSRSALLSSTMLIAAEARHEVSIFCQEVGCAAKTIDAALLVASELATNAFLHGRPPIELELLSAPTSLTIRVLDDSPEHAVLGRARPDSGRGLALVSAVATTWSSDRLPDDGKVVWARLQL